MTDEPKHVESAQVSGYEPGDVLAIKAKGSYLSSTPFSGATGKLKPPTMTPEQREEFNRAWDPERVVRYHSGWPPKLFSA
jgi:hypothetical protein